MKDETITLTDAATFTRLATNEPDQALDLLEGMTRPELITLTRQMVTLTGLARTFRTGTAERPSLTLQDWCTAVIDKETTTPATTEPRPRRRPGRSNRVHLCEAFAAGPYGDSDPFGYGPDTDDDND